MRDQPLVSAPTGQQGIIRWACRPLGCVSRPPTLRHGGWRSHGLKPDGKNQGHFGGGPGLRVEVSGLIEA
jgi:hypothetical protein